MFGLKIFLTGLMVLIAASFECEMDESFDKRIDKDLSIFKTGITPRMIWRAKCVKVTTTFIIRNH